MTLRLTAIPDIPEILPGDDLAAILASRVDAAGLELGDGDVLVVCQKVVSKAEERFVSLSKIVPDMRAHEVAAACGKDPSFVHAVLGESERVVRTGPNVLIVRHRLGLVMANAGIDRSNIGGDGDSLLLLPSNPDASAAALHQALGIAVIISDSFGRAWRQGVTAAAIGVAGIVALEDRRGERDRFGRELKVTQIAVADQIATAAALLSGEGAEGLPAVIVSGLAPRWLGKSGTAADLIRPPEQDIFL